jgi:hypothetical protein
MDHMGLLANMMAGREPQKLSFLPSMGLGAMIKKCL